LDVLVLAHPSDPHWERMVPGGSPLLSGGELGAIEAFVRDGGGLIVLATGPPHATSSPPMSRPRPAHGGRPARAAMPTRSCGLGAEHGATLNLTKNTLAARTSHTG
jgi:hypothetical protein